MSSNGKTSVALNVAIYLRKSRTDIEEERKARDKGETYDTLSRHRKQLMDIARREGYNVIDIFEEVVSGEFLSEREEATEMLRKVALSYYDAVLCVDVDRLTRGSKVDEHRIETAFRQSGTILITVDEVIDFTQESQELSIDLKMMLSRIDHKKIKKRLHAGRLRSTSEGKEMSTKPPYGYHKDENLKLVIYEPEAQIVRKIYQWSLDGVGRVKIAERLNDMDIPSPSGKGEWGHASIRRILKSPKYKGAMFFGKNQSIKSEGSGYLKKARRDDKKYVYIEDTHEPIIPREMWEAVQVGMENRKTNVNPNKKLINPFASLIKCKKCGHTLLANNPKTRPSIYLYCSTKDCDTKMISTDKVEAAVIDFLKVTLEQLNSTNINHNYNVQLEEQTIDEIQKIEQEIEKDAERRDKLHDLLENGTYDKATFLERMRVIQERRKNYDQQLHRLHRKLDQLQTQTQGKKDLKPLIENVLDKYDPELSAGEKNELFKSVIHVIRYQRDRDWTDKDHFKLDIELKY